MADFNEEQLKRISFHLLTFKNPRARQHVLRNHVKIEDFFLLEPRQLQVSGLFPEEIKAVRERNWSEAEREAGRLDENGIRIVFRGDQDYPPLLDEIYDPPDLIYVRGDPSLLRREKLAVVGSRRGSAYGQSALNRVLPDCCRAGLVIVSGMAFGIDSMAHRLALRENGGTIGVNAGGLLHLNPPGNSALLRRIVERGAIISEFPLDVTPRPFLFPVRNRIISGISRAVLVVEAAMRSGSLITARLALDQDRDVLAVPGNIDSSLSQGTNFLLQQGAKLVTAAADILEEFGLAAPAHERATADLGPKEKKILDLCGENEVKDIDFLVEKLDLSTAEAISLLMGLVLKNLIIEDAGGYRRIHHG
ncbi:MAG: DNA-processing protein DprA [Acidobacteria bacterium]|jgi:DNA processing protein|nr:DNA-processing protein DprA [Acidobacteriota bacterium]